MFSLLSTTGNLVICMFRLSTTGATVSADLLRYPEIGEISVLWAAWLASSYDTYPVPSLVMTGDLDALTRVTLFSTEFT